MRISTRRWEIKRLLVVGLGSEIGPVQQHAVALWLLGASAGMLERA